MAKAKGKTTEKGLTTNEKIDLQSDLRRFGYLLPTNEEEVEEFDKMFGKTQSMFPEELNAPAFLNTPVQEVNSPGNLRVVANVLPAKKDEAQLEPTKKKGKGDYFKKLVLAAEVANQLHTEPTFGHKKFVKVYMLCDKVCEMNLNSVYGRYAAGPLDPKQMYTFDAEFKKKQWFKVKKTGHGYRYTPDTKLHEYQLWYGRYFKNELDDIARVIDLFRRETSDFCEIVATIFFVWMESIERLQLISNASLIKDFYAWDESKARFTESRLIEAIDWMNENGITPKRKS